LLAVSFLIIVFFGYGIGDYDSYQRVLTFGFPAGIILIALLNLENNHAISFPKFTLTLGDASYALYLIHFPMMLLMNKLPQLLGFTLVNNQEIWYSYFIIIFIVITSIYAHRWIEIPMAKKLINLLRA
jgi:peptidoglycan/LPS O-acetylase OafA/YrhL